MPNDGADTADAEQQASDRAPSQLLAEQQRGQYRGEDRIGADDQAAETGRYGLQAGIAEPEIERVVGDAEDRKHCGLAPTKLPGLAAERREAEDQDSRQRKPRGEQDQRRAITDTDLAELLRSFVSVVDSGGFTRAGERVHRTQSTVSQQIKRLEDDVGQPLLNRSGKDVTPTEAGERLLSYARRLLSLAEEARDVMAQPDSQGAIRLGIPEDFAAYQLAQLLAAFSRSHPGLRLDVRADQSTYLRRDLERGDIDLALLKRDAGEKGGIAVWPERVHWVTSKAHPIDANVSSVPLIGFPAGCLYRTRAIHAIESAGRSWHMAYTSSSLAGIQAAVAAGLGVSILSEMAIQADHRVLTAKDGFAPIDKTEVAVVGAPDASPVTLRLADRLADFCNSVQAKAA